MADVTLVVVVVDIVSRVCDDADPAAGESPGGGIGALSRLRLYITTPINTAAPSTAAPAMAPSIINTVELTYDNVNRDTYFSENDMPELESSASSSHETLVCVQHTSRISRYCAKFVCKWTVTQVFTINLGRDSAQGTAGSYQHCVNHHNVFCH